MRTVSFNTLLTAFAGAARVGRTDLQASETDQLCADLNAAALWLWETETHGMALPDMIKGKTVTLGTGGVIAAADIEDASFWSVWQSDPREKPMGERHGLQLPATSLSNGDVKVIDKAAATSVFVIYKSVPPQWTVTEASAACSYAIGDLVYACGKVYKALVTEPTTGDFTDTASWVEVTLPQSLQRIIVLKANNERLRLGANMPENAGRERAELLAAFDAAVLAASAEVGTKPWLYNQNQ
jgi:hypothetical protein